MSTNRTKEKSNQLKSGKKEEKQETVVYSRDFILKSTGSHAKVKSFKHRGTRI